MLFREPERLDDPQKLSGKTIQHSRNLKSAGNKVKLLYISFTDGDYCIIASDDPRIGVHLVGDDERIIPKV